MSVSSELEHAGSDGMNTPWANATRMAVNSWIEICGSHKP